MNLRGILNTLLIGLTLSTVILTLIVYFIFKIRQGFPQKKNVEKNLLEGFYFKRIAPHLAEENAIAKQALEALKTRKQFTMKPWIAFALIFASVLLFLIIDNQLSFYNIIKGRAPEKALIDELNQKGMLQEYQFKSDLAQDFFHYYQQEQAEQTHRLLEEMRAKTIGVYYNEHTDKAELQIWLDYLKSLGLNTLLNRKLTNFGNSDIIIIPSTTYLDNNEINDITDKVKQGKSLLIVGSIGVKYSTSTRVQTSYPNNIKPPLFKKLGLNDSIDCTREAGTVPNRQISMTLNAKSLIPWSLPTATALRFRAASSCKVINALESSPEIIIESSATGINSKKVYARLLGKNLSPIIWINAIPNPANIGSLEDLFWSQTLNYLAYPNQARIAKWGAGPDSIISLAIAGDSDYSNSRELKDILSKTKIPFTAFLTSEVYSTNNEALFKGSESIEIASMGESISDLTKMNLAGLFKSIQNSRLDTELLAQTEVKGFRFPYDKFSWELLSPIFQNRIQYVLGVNDFSWHEPVPLAPNFYYLPIHTESFNELCRRRDIASETDFRKLVASLIANEKQNGGHLILRIDPALIMEQPYLKFLNVMIEELEKNKENIVNLATSASFAQSRREVTFKLGSDNKLTIENHGSETYNRIKFWTSNKLEPDNFIENETEIEGNYLYIVKTLPPNKLIHLNWVKKL